MAVAITALECATSENYQLAATFLWIFSAVIGIDLFLAAFTLYKTLTISNTPNTDPVTKSGSPLTNSASGQS